MTNLKSRSDLEILLLKQNINIRQNFWGVRKVRTSQKSLKGTSLDYVMQIQIWQWVAVGFLSFSFILHSIENVCISLHLSAFRNFNTYSETLQYSLPARCLLMGMTDFICILPTMVVP